MRAEGEVERGDEKESYLGVVVSRKILGTPSDLMFGDLSELAAPTCDCRGWKTIRSEWERPYYAYGALVCYAWHSFGCF